MTRRLIAWLGLFALFAVGFDVLHVMVLETYSPAIEHDGAIEDSGEMICASILVCGLTLEPARA